MGKMMIHSKVLATVAVLGLVCLAAPARADIGMSIDTAMMEFDYFQVQGGQGVVGMFEVRLTNNSTINAQKLDLGGDNDFGGGDDTVLDIAKINGYADPDFTRVLSGQVIKLGANDYILQGVYELYDYDADLALQGDFVSSFVALSGSALYMGGSVTNPDGVLRPGSPNTSWEFNGNPVNTPDMINGGFGGHDGIDGRITVPDGRSSYSLANLLEFQFVGEHRDLDALFGLESFSSTIANANLSIKPVPIPEPGGVVLGLIGLGAIARLRRRLG